MDKVYSKTNWYVFGFWSNWQPLISVFRDFSEFQPAEAGPKAKGDTAIEKGYSKSINTLIAPSFRSTKVSYAV